MPENSSFSYRKARPEDAFSIASIHVASWRAAYSDIVPAQVLDIQSIDKQSKFWQEALEKGVEVVVADDSTGEMIGWIAFGAMNDEPGNGEVFAVYLHPDYFRQGVGTALWAIARDRLCEQGHSRIIIYVIAENTPARSFYERSGFEFVEGSESTFNWEGESIPEVRYEYKIDIDQTR